MFEVALHRKRIPKSIQSTFLLTPLRLKLKKIQGLFKNLHRNLRTFQGKMEFKDFSRTPPKIQGLFKTVRTLLCFDIFSAEGNNVTLTEFEASATGMINSFTTRFPGNNSVLEELWRADMPYHKL